MKKYYEKILRNAVIPLALLILTITLMTFNSCDKLSDIITPQDIDITNEGSLIKNVNELLNIMTASASYINKAAKTGNILSPGCPTITVIPSSQTITVSYGNSPCMDLSDSLMRSGSYSISYYFNSSKDSLAGSISFSNYTVYRRSGFFGDTNYVKFTGTDKISMKRNSGQLNYQSVFTMSNNTISNFSSPAQINMNLNIIADFGDSVIFNDDIYDIAGYGTVSGGNDIYGYNIDNANHLILYNSCRYHFPEQGRVTLILSGNDFGVDFYPNGGVCDAVVMISKYGFSKVVDLLSVDY
ncbi:MAG: hypothetical protein FJ216_06295 [Ignavibacteria bacterium]|nr:hypothetical protein [Ignavibacteria bacterium]